MIISTLKKLKYKLKIYSLIKAGLTIGKGHRIYTNYKMTEPYLVSMGDFVSIGTNVQLITHDGAIWTIRNITRNNKIDWFGTIKIGSNVFIGNNSVILPNTKIGSNIIIGANSLVKGNLEDNFVYVGSPLKKICSIEDYHNKHKSKFVNTKGLNSSLKKEIILNNLKN